jgi:hypothetical protein
MKYTCGLENTEIEINLPEGINKKILFGISGGADSAILLYIIAKLNRDQKTNHKIIPFTVPRPDGGANYSTRIVEWISDKLDILLPFPMIVGDGNLPHNIVVKTVIKDLMNSNLYDFLYIAENKIPPVEIEGLAPIRAPQPNYKRAALPFWGVTKDCTLDLYYKENIPELLELTHTCTEQTKGRCNKCFQCNERSWAFSKLGIIDPGKL